MPDIASGLSALAKSLDFKLGSSSHSASAIYNEKAMRRRSPFRSSVGRPWSRVHVPVLRYAGPQRLTVHEVIGTAIYLALAVLLYQVAPLVFAILVSLVFIGILFAFGLGRRPWRSGNGRWRLPPDDDQGNALVGARVLPPGPRPTAVATQEWPTE